MTFLPDFEEIDDQYKTQIIISHIFTLLTPSLPYTDPTNRKILKSYIYEPCNKDTFDLQQRLLTSVYFHVPSHLYDPKIPEIIQKQRHHLPTDWIASYAHSDIVFQAFSLIDGFGCKHRVCGALLKCENCNEFFSCKHCHNEVKDHEFPFQETKVLKCLKCKKEQAFSQGCQFCDFPFGVPESTCLQCRRLDFMGNQNWVFFHCQKCQKCWVGEEHDFTHCEVCQTCVKNDQLKCHKCSVESVCSVCLEDVKNGSMGYLILDCGHSLHSYCEEKLFSSGQNACPVCRKFMLTGGQKSIYLQVYSRFFWLGWLKWKLFGLTGLVNCQCNDCGEVSVIPNMQVRNCLKCSTFNCFPTDGGDEEFQDKDSEMLIIEFFKHGYSKVIVLEEFLEKLQINLTQLIMSLSSIALEDVPSEFESLLVMLVN